MHNIDLKLLLLAGRPIPLDDVCLVYPLKLSEIVDIGYTTYSKYVHLIMLSPKDLIQGEVPKGLEDVTALEIISASPDKSLRSMFEDAIKLFTKEDEVYLSISLNRIFLGKIGGDRYIDIERFRTLRDIIAYQNYLRQVGKTEQNPVNKKAQEILDKLKKSREKIAKIKNSSNDSDIDLSDIISAVSSMSHSINKFNVFDLTLYQLYDEYRRLEVISQYEIAIQSMLHGATGVELKHWSSKLDS